MPAGPRHPRSSRSVEFLQRPGGATARGRRARGDARPRRREPVRRVGRRSWCSCGTGSRSSASDIDSAGRRSRVPRRDRAHAGRRRRQDVLRLRAMYRGAARRIRVLPAASHTRARPARVGLRSAATRASPVTGEPRVDVLSAGSDEGRRSAAPTLGGRRSRPPGDELRGRAPSCCYARRRARRRTRTRRCRLGGGVGALIVAAAGPARRRRCWCARAPPRRRGPTSRPSAARRAGCEPLRQRPQCSPTSRRPACRGLDALVTDYSSLAFDAATGARCRRCHLAPDVQPSTRGARGFYGRLVGRRGRRSASADWARAADAAGRLSSGDCRRASPAGGPSAPPR